MAHMKTREDKSRRIVFAEAQANLLTLLDDHPHFRAGIRNIRKSFGLPAAVYTDPAEALAWGRDKEKSRPGLERAILALIDDFNIQNIFRSEVFNHAFDTLLCGRSTSKTNPIVVDFRSPIYPSGNVQVDGRRANWPGTIAWMPVDRWTTSRDVLQMFKKVIGGRQPKGIKKFSAPKPSGKEREAWARVVDKYVAAEDGKAATNRTSGNRATADYTGANKLVHRYIKKLDVLRRVERLKG